MLLGVTVSNPRSPKLREENEKRDTGTFFFPDPTSRLFTDDVTMDADDDVRWISLLGRGQDEREKRGGEGRGKGDVGKEMAWNKWTKTPSVYTQKI